MLNKLHIITSIIASIITIILGLYLKLKSTEIITRVIIVIIVCYFIGLIAKLYLTKVVFNNKKEVYNIETIDNQVQTINEKDKEENDDL